MGLLVVSSLALRTWLTLECTNQVLVTSTNTNRKDSVYQNSCCADWKNDPKKTTLCKFIVCNWCQQGAQVIMGEINEKTCCAELICTSSCWGLIFLYQFSFAAAVHLYSMLISVWGHMHARPTKPRIQRSGLAHSATPAVGIWGSTLMLAADSPFSP